MSNQCTASLILHLFFCLSVIASNFQTCLGLLMHYPPLGDINSLLQKALFLRDPRVSHTSLINWKMIIHVDSVKDQQLCSLLVMFELVTLHLPWNSRRGTLSTFIMTGRSQVKMEKRKGEMFHIKWKSFPGALVFWLNVPTLSSFIQYL